MPESKADSTMMRPLADFAGRVIGGRYRVAALLGSGGVGVVYEAEHVETRAPCALKMLLPSLPDAGEIAARFRREVKVTSLLDHPNIVSVLDVVAEGNDLYLVMEVLRGRSLAQTFDDGGALAPRRALVLARQILEGLGHAHERGVIHRDLKPGNIMLVHVQGPGGEVERVKLVDFGLAKLVGNSVDDERLTNAGIVFGTPAYLAPEQAMGRVVDGRADLYAAGIVLVEMLVGRPPFRSPDPVTLSRMHVSAPIPTLASLAPDRPWTTPELEALVARALAKQAEERFATASAMIDALDAAFASIDHV